jgi:AraC family transcriptional regulator of arabinose operon
MQSIETTHPSLDQILTGQYRQGPEYATWRTKGTTSWLLIYTQDGGGRFGHCRGQIVTHSGDLMLLRPGTLHDYGTAPAEGSWTLLWAHFHPRAEWLEWLGWPEEAPGLMRLQLKDFELRRRVSARFRAVHRLASGGLPHSASFAMNALEEVLLWCETAIPGSQTAKLDLRIQQAINLLSLNLSEPFSLCGLAAELDLSTSRLSHLFREQTGETPQKYLERRRIHRARQLLELTSRTVQSIAVEVGYENAFYFSLRFKKLTAVSPSEYRRRLTEAL